MTMFLYNVISAEVEPAHGPVPGWFQLTGNKILRENYDDADEALQDHPDNAVVADAKLHGIHDFDEGIAESDPRFDDSEVPGFGVVKLNDGSYRMYLNVNRAEYCLFRFLCRNRLGEMADNQRDPESNYRTPF